MLDLPANAKDRLIVALDFDTKQQAMELVEKLGDQVDFYKVGWQLFFGTHFETVKYLTGLGKKVFLDLKMTDIPATIQQAIKNAPAEYVDFLELMTLAGVSDMVRAARDGAQTNPRLKFLMLTVLSSMDDKDIKELYGNDATLEKIISYTARKALEANCHGLIASGDSVRQLREEFGDNFIIVTPGIRPEGSSTDDHKRSLTPYEAIMKGANYLVVGRPICKSPDPKGVAQSIIADIDRALSDLRKQTAAGHSTGFESMARVASG